FRRHAAPTESFALSLHDALPISIASRSEETQRPPVRRTSSASPSGASPSIHTTLRSSVTLIGPCRYSIAGYDSAQDSEASRSLRDRKSTRLNSSHVKISYAVFCL